MTECYVRRPRRVCARASEQTQDREKYECTHEDVSAGEADCLVVPCDNSAVDAVRELVDVLSEDAGLWEDQPMSACIGVLA